MVENAVVVSGESDLNLTAEKANVIDISNSSYAEIEITKTFYFNGGESNYQIAVTPVKEIEKGAKIYI